MAAQDRKVVTKQFRYISPQNIMANYNNILFINTGSVTASIGLFPLAPGASIGWAHNQNEINVTQMNISFQTNEGAEVWCIYTLFDDTPF